MDNLTPDELVKYQYLSKQSLAASNGMSAPLTPEENNVLKELYNKTKGGVNTEATTAVAQLTRQEQKDLHTVLLEKRNKALKEEGPNLTPNESKEFFELDKIFNPRNSYGGRISKKRPTTPRRRSSKARKSRKSRKARKSRATRRR